MASLLERHFDTRIPPVCNAEETVPFRSRCVCIPPNKQLGEKSPTGDSKEKANPTCSMQFETCCCCCYC